MKQRVASVDSKPVSKRLFSVFSPVRNLFCASSAIRRTGVIHAVTDVELASRLSFFFWSSIPDDALLKLASEGKPEAPGCARPQVRRMLADAKSARNR